MIIFEEKWIEVGRSCPIKEKRRKCPACNKDLVTGKTNKESFNFLYLNVIDTL